MKMLIYRRRIASENRQGFALVVTLSLMILLTVVAVGLLTLSNPPQLNQADTLKLGTFNWLLYSNHNQGGFRRDVQHTNSPFTPDLSLLQMSFRLSSEELAPTPPSTAIMSKATYLIDDLAAWLLLPAAVLQAVEPPAPAGTDAERRRNGISTNSRSI
jgi:hypothetical protein